MLILNTHMLGQLNNSLQYDIVDSDPALDHFEQVKTWVVTGFLKGSLIKKLPHGLQI